ncbi:NAD(P)-dependent oxidoreductase [Candidatus Viadribacter manganicus]|uniref:Oxidoreductase n=1 Tax=Candidatus Viadribacter manganicus TaxID=1759059 RepID=A0A1B1ADJ5_9PROT|nr:NAD(P)-dependent oxidoreductase [Candidatus Viadribacter manganicus]ANP44629.1 oxidoreductase [Candidatus Viadribacter manganicus]
MAKTAFIGLGVMGGPMAGHLARAGHDVAVYNRTEAKARDWAQKHKGRTYTSVAKAAEGVDIVFSCVGNDRDLREVFDAAASTMRKGAIFVDHTTASAEIARELAAKAEELGLGFLDAPVSGGQAGAEAGRLTVMAGGDPPSFAEAQPIMSAYAANMTLIGPAGSGQLAKMVNQICIAGVLQGLAEALHFGKRADLDIEKVIAAISKGAAQSWQMENRWKTMDEGRFDFGFAVDWMRKDLGLVLDEAERNGSKLELTKLVDAYYADVQAMGGKRWDTSSLIARLERPRS